MLRALASLFATACLLPFPALAEAVEEPGDEIVVTGHALRDMGLMAGSVEIEGDELVRASAPQIGDLLASLPGVSATSFAPGASRPVLRGLTGDRVQVLIDGLGAIDASSVSADHGVALDTLTIDHIDVLHGPAVLAFGGQAIGGAVNAYDRRIPRRVPSEGFDLTALAGFASAASEKSASASLDAAVGGQIVAHADASWRRGGDLRVGGHVLSPQLRGELGEDGPVGRIPNSFARGSTFGAGAAWIGDRDNIGLSVQRIDNRYGIPARPGAGEEGVSIDMGQTRLDLRGELGLSGPFESLHLRAAWADYGHDELEPDGAVGTRFGRKGAEARLELVQSERGGWSGRSGAQFSAGRLKVAGEEAILPDNRDRRFGLFTFQQVKTGKVELEAAGRIERVSLRAASLDFDRSFTLFAAAAGIAFVPREGFKAGVNYAHGQRAPSPEELLTEGLHVATQAFEIGDPTFGKERSNGLEAYLRYDTPRTKLSATAYYTRLSGFIAPLPTGEVEEGFPVYAYRQLPARFIGFEAQASQRFGAIALDATADYTRARLKGVGPVPRIPPLRLMGGVEYASGALTLRGEVEWSAAQRRIAQFENPTRAFILANLSADWKPLGEDGPLTLLLSAENLFDAVGRRAASVTRDFVPVSGRDIRLTAKLAF